MIILLSYFASICVGLLAVAPPIDYSIPLMVNSFHWVYMVIAAGLFGMFLLSKELTLTLKILAVFLFISCFVSKAPYLSFNAYVLCIACFYFILIFKKCDYDIIFKMIEAIFWLQVFLTIMQLLGRDTLINFDRPNQPVFLGTIMQYMRFSSLLALLAPLLIIKNKWYIIPVVIMAIFSKSSSFALALIGGMFTYYSLKLYKKYFLLVLLTAILAAVGYIVLDKGSFQIAFTVGRIPVWIDIFKTWIMDTSQAQAGHLIGPINWKAIAIGHGMDTFLPLFPILKHDMNPFTVAHNCWLQFLWEIGLVGTGLLVAYAINLARRLYTIKEYILIAGLSCIGINMFFAFPTRMTQCVLIMLCYIAYCEKIVNQTRRK